MRHFVLLAALLVTGCEATYTQTPHPDAGMTDDLDGAVAADAANDAAVDAAPTCNGSEPCAVNPVMTPPGYTVQPYLKVTNLATESTCTSFADCDMWNTHYTSNWLNPDNTPVDPYYSKMGSMFPWPLARYTFELAPNRIAYAKFHVAARGETYVYSDNSKEMRFDRASGTNTCFKRSTAQLQSAWLADLGGTNVHGSMKWTISELPGDMGDSGNVSACQATTGWNFRPVTFDPAFAAAHPGTCLLREGHDYYFNVQSLDCGNQAECTFGWQLMAVTTVNDANLVDAVPCQ